MLIILFKFLTLKSVCSMITAVWHRQAYAEVGQKLIRHWHFKNWMPEDHTNLLIFSVFKNNSEISKRFEKIINCRMKCLSYYYN